MNVQRVDELLQPLRSFLPCATPDAWIAAAVNQQEVLLLDHANCEKKAASTAMNLMYRYVDKPDLLFRMSRLAREELLHFEQVNRLIVARGHTLQHLSASRYAAGLRTLARNSEPGKLIDILIIGALIEARSCERFASLIPFLDSELGAFYYSLLKSEARHFEDYLSLAKGYATAAIDDRILLFAAKERELIESPDSEFRFHSGVPG